MVIVKDPIGFRLIRNIILVSTFFSIIMTGIQLFLDYKSETDAMNERLKQVKNSSLESISHTLWQSNNELVKIQLKNLLSFNDITYAAVKEEGSLTYSFGEDLGEDTLQKEYALSYMYNGVRYELGVLTLQASLKLIRDRVFDRFILIAITQSIKTFIVAFLILYIFSYMITRHLYRVVDYAYSIGEKGLEQKPLVLDLNGKEDELHLLEDALNMLQKRVHSKLEKRQNENLKLGELNSILERRIISKEVQDNQIIVDKDSFEEIQSIVQIMIESSDTELAEQDVKSLDILLRRAVKES